MLDAQGSQELAPPPEPGAAALQVRRRHRRAIVGFAGLALLCHAALLGGIDSLSLGPGRDESGTSMTVRTIAPEPAAEAALAADAPPAAAAAPPPPRPRPPRPPRSAREPSRLARADGNPAIPEPEAGARNAGAEVAPAPEPAASEAAVAATIDADRSAVDAGASAVDAGANAAVAGAPTQVVAPTVAVPTEPAASVAAIAPTLAATPSFLDAGESPPPVYRARLPPPATLRYEVRRGFFRGTGEIRWQPSGDSYELRLDARLAGITLMSLTSQGRIEPTGLAPARFLDQRARRSAQAANFNREPGTITFSGPSITWPLLPGSQDLLSWMIQLSGIVAAEPERASEGGWIAMVIVDARGRASVRTIRYAGHENVETASGTVHAAKFVVPGRAVGDSSYEIWLDPAHSFLPAHATQRDGSGESQLDLLLESFE